MDIEPSRAQARTRTRAPERLLAAGVLLFGVGAVAAIATLLPLFLGSRRLPTAVYLIAVLLAPLGLALCLLSLLAGVRRRRQLVEDALAADEPVGVSFPQR